MAVNAAALLVGRRALAERLVSEAKRIGKIEGRECSTLTYHALFDSTIADASELLRGYETFTVRPYRLHEAPGAAPRRQIGRASCRERV